MSISQEVEDIIIDELKRQPRRGRRPKPGDLVVSLLHYHLRTKIPGHKGCMPSIPVIRGELMTVLKIGGKRGAGRNYNDIVVLTKGGQVGIVLSSLVERADVVFGRKEKANDGL